MSANRSCRIPFDHDPWIRLQHVSYQHSDKAVLIDSVDGITLSADKIHTYWNLLCSSLAIAVGLHTLAESIMALEDNYMSQDKFRISSVQAHPEAACIAQWFSISSINFVHCIARIIYNIQKPDLSLRTFQRKYRKDVLGQPLITSRNKIAAHLAEAQGDGRDSTVDQ
ncbi:MAG TPA: hypothetical protein ENJ00_00900, partial [Phycisphaerales bacterium]|nr:hypothetical protein [Phycisphaerales bacterium]